MRLLALPLYQPALILTHEDCHSRSLARSSGSGDVVHRRDAATKSSGREWQPCGRFLVALGQRRVLLAMNHIATSDAPCREPPETVLMGQDQCRLVLGDLCAGGCSALELNCFPIVCWQLFCVTTALIGAVAPFMPGPRECSWCA